MKFLFYSTMISLFVFGLGSCHQSLDLPVASCELPFADSSHLHIKNEAFQAILDNYVQKGLPGVVMLVHSPQEGLWIGASGKSVLESGKAMNTCNLFHSASVAKTYMVATAMSLVEDGILALDATIDTYLPKEIYSRLPNGTKATVRHLMNHRSGIPDFIEETEHILDYYNNLMHVFTTDDYLEYIYDKKARFEPGKAGSYSNTNTVILALVMEHATGVDHASLLTQRILNKIGLNDTYYKNEEGYPAPTGLVNTYVEFRGSGQLQNSTDLERNFAKMNIAHDALIASPYDYFRFISGLFRGEIISRPFLDEMISKENKLGVFVFPSETFGVTKIGHDGGSLGAANLVFHYPEKETTIIICSNFGGFLDSKLSDMFYGYRVGKEGTIIGEVESLLFK